MFNLVNLNVDNFLLLEVPKLHVATYTLSSNHFVNFVPVVTFCACRFLEQPRRIIHSFKSLNVFKDILGEYDFFAPSLFISKSHLGVFIFFQCLIFLIMYICV